MASKTNHAPERHPGQGYRTLAAALLQRVAPCDAVQPLVLHWATSGDLRHAPRGTLLNRQGAPGSGLILVVEGVVAVGRVLGSRAPHLLTFLGSGDLHGFVPVTDRGPETHDLQAHEDSVVLTVPPSLVAASMRQQPLLGMALMQYMAHRKRLLYDRLHEAVALPLNCRLARQLLQLGRMFGTPRPEGLVLSVRLSQANLAAVLGAGRQQVNSELKKLEQRGLIQLSRTAIVLLKPEALASASNDVPPPGPAARGALHGYHLLVVDDDDVYRLLVTTWLQEAGAHVDVAENGAVAVERVRSTALAYDAILMDDKMPVLSGAEATRRIRAHEAANGSGATPILCISSASAKHDADRYRAAGMTAFVPKPTEPMSLLQTLQPLLAS